MWLLVPLKLYLLREVIRCVRHWLAKVPRDWLLVLLLAWLFKMY